MFSRLIGALFWAQGNHRDPAGACRRC